MRQTAQRSDIVQFFIGAVVFAIVLFLIFRLPELVKLLGVPFSALPTVAGVMEPVAREEIAALTLAPRTIRVEHTFTEAGPYLVQTRDNDLLSFSSSEKIPSWLKVIDGAGNQLPVAVVWRGVRPYDTLLVPGRPSARFEIGAPGTYLLEYPNSQNEPTDIAVVPDRLVEREQALSRWYVGQLLVIVGAGYYWWRVRTAAVRRAKSAEKFSKRERDAAFRDYQQRRKKELE